ncbi:TPA: hypothetical protein N0F65_010779 [Lagenidium giganteum]|uniref:Uncharacterized protein n=1 Tax=Lagenidium giganteum TaxID=4803 RepID=A0AAV2YTL4_9STRA|nr:TPA: hypothetical protein N0F65_010779 [Lagenidium giganteum]
MSADSSSPGTPVSPANSDEISEDGDPGSTPPPVHRTRKGVHSEEEESSTSSSAAPRKTNAYRKRQRQELEYLRDKVKELETQLSELETARNADTRMDANLSTVWEGIAIKQKQETRRVEQENAELREAIEDQIKLATLLQKMLTKRPRLAILDRLAPSRFEACMSAEEAAAARRQELFAKLPERYMELNTVFEETRLDKMAKDTRSKGFGITKSPEGRESLYIQLLESKVVPFNVAKVLAACKRFFADPNKALNHGTYHVCFPLH